MYRNNNSWLLDKIIYILAIIILMLLASRSVIVELFSNLQADIPYRAIGSGRYLSIYDAMSLLSLLPLLVILERKSLFREYIIFISVITIYIIFITYQPASYTIDQRFNDPQLKALCYKYLSLAIGCSFIFTIICWLLVRLLKKSCTLDVIFDGIKGIIYFSIIIIFNFLLPLIVSIVTP